MPKPLQAACPIPQPTLKQCLLDSAMLAGCLRHCSAKSMRGSKLNFGRSTSQVRSKQTIQGLSKTQSYSSQGAGHAWGEQPLCSPVTCAVPASFGGSLCSNTTGTGQPLQRALGSKDETAQVLLPRHRGSDCSHRLRTAEPHCTEAWLLWWVGEAWQRPHCHLSCSLPLLPGAFSTIGSMIITHTRERLFKRLLKAYSRTPR